jgi:hypothetical protein
MSKTLRVKLFGESFKLHKLKIDEYLLAQFYKVSNELSEPLHLAIFNINFFRILNIEEVKSFNDIIEKTFFGLINNYKSHIEISLGRRRIAKFKLDELFMPNTLFPIYNTELFSIDTIQLNSILYVVEKEVGLIGLYEVNTEKFQIDLLKFNLTKFHFSSTNYEVLHTITYNKQVVPLIKNDTLLTYQNCIIKK